MSETHETKVNVNVNSGSSGLVGVLIAFFFNVFGAFFAWWLMAKWSFLKSFLYALGFTVAFVISFVLCFFVIGFVLLPIVDIVMLILVYKACDNKSIQIEMPSVQTQTIDK